MRENTEDIKYATGNLLAIIHRDGGHCQDEHGTVKALEDAIEVITELRVKLDHALHHKDDPITQWFKCNSCGGYGKCTKDGGPFGSPTVPCPNPHCKDGLVEMTLCSVVEETKYGLSPRGDLLPHPKIYTSITHGSIPADFNKCEWRVL